MRQMNLSLGCCLLCAALASCNRPTPLDQLRDQAPGEASAYPPENTGRNARDREGATLVPTDQSNEEQDLKITRDLRQLLVSDPGLSVAAQNVKIVTVSRVVTLRGPVKSREEKASIERAAEIVRGVASVDNQLDVSTQ